MACIFLLFLLFVASCSEAPAQTQNKTYFWETDSLMPVLSEKDYPAGGEFSKTVSIKFDGEKVSYSKANGVGISTDKGHVTVTSTAEDVKFVLSGKSDAGSLSLESSHRCMIQLDGVELASSGGPAIEITSKKRTFIQAVGASVLSSDSATVHSHGELTFTGGTFTLKSSDSHTIACSQHIAVLDGTFNLEAAGDGFHAKKMFVMNDGSVNVTAGSNGVEVTKGSIRIDGGTVNVKSSGNCISASYEGSDADMRAAVVVNGGTISLETDGEKGKGIKTWNYFRMNGGDLCITTRGRGKGIRAEGSIYYTGGRTFVDCYGNEGIEAKRDIFITGGDIVVFSTDDAINSGRKLVIDDGTVYASASGNDGLDSNGSIEINGGVVVGLACGVPEEGIDCDFGTVAFNGGTILGMGGTIMSRPTASACKQNFQFIQGNDLERGILDIRDSKGNQLLDIVIHRSYRNAVILFSHPGLEVGEDYTISAGGSVKGGNLLHEYLFDGGSYEDGQLLATFTQADISTQGGRGGFGGFGMGPGGPGGFGGPMGGGFPGGPEGGFQGGPEGVFPERAEGRFEGPMGRGMGGFGRPGMGGGFPGGPGGPGGFGGFGGFGGREDSSFIRNFKL